MATEYSGIWPEGRLPAVEETLTTRPQPRSAIAGIAARISAHRRHHVQLPGRLPVLVGDVVELSPLRLAGVVDDHVEAAEALGRLLEDALARVGVGDVERKRRRLAALGAAASAAALGELVLAARDEQDGRALLAEAVSDVEADAAAGAGDDARLAGEAEVHVSDGLDRSSIR